MFGAKNRCKFGLPKGLIYASASSLAKRAYETSASITTSVRCSDWAFSGWPAGQSLLGNRVHAQSMRAVARCRSAHQVVIEASVADLRSKVASRPGLRPWSNTGDFRAIGPGLRPRAGRIDSALIRPHLLGKHCLAGWISLGRPQLMAGGAVRFEVDSPPQGTSTVLFGRKFHVPVSLFALWAAL